MVAVGFDVLMWGSKVRHVGSDVLDGLPGTVNDDVVDGPDLSE